jgi:hypothetical protein
MKTKDDLLKQYKNSIDKLEVALSNLSTYHSYDDIPINIDSMCICEMNVGMLRKHIHAQIELFKYCIMMVSQRNHQ